MAVVVSAHGQSLADPCAEIALPAAVQKRLTKFRGWKIETVADLHPHYRSLWLKSNPGQCPGIAIGHFRTKTQLSYALLLVRSDRNKPGYELLVMGGESQQRDASSVLEGWTKPLTSDVVIHTVPPGKYSDPHGEQSVNLDLEGIHFEQMEVGGAVFFWRGGRYHKLILSE